MQRTRLTTAVAASAAAILAASSVALAAGDPTPSAPPRIAFVAHAFNPADALAVGPIAGQLGAPLFTTSPGGLSDGAELGLVAYAPELVLVAGGPGAIADSVLDEIRAATGLTGDAVDRVFGAGRTETAAELASLFDDRGINPAFLPVGATATDADLLDGLDSTAFLTTADSIDADTLDGATVAEVVAGGVYTDTNEQGVLAGNSTTEIASVDLVDVPNPCPGAVSNTWIVTASGYTLGAVDIEIRVERSFGGGPATEVGSPTFLDVSGGTVPWSRTFAFTGGQGLTLDLVFENNTGSQVIFGATELVVQRGAITCS